MNDREDEGGRRRRKADKPNPIDVHVGGAGLCWA
jgi:hypothetical protein